MENRRVEDNTKGNKQIHRVKFIVACMLIGSVVAGSFFGWIGAPFDIRIVGASIGAGAGLIANHLA